MLFIKCPSIMNTNSCKICKKTFCTRSALRKHVMKFRPGKNSSGYKYQFISHMLLDKVEELAPRKIYKSVAMCNECNKSFVKYSNLKKHVIRFHKGKFLQLNDVPICIEYLLL